MIEAPNAMTELPDFSAALPGPAGSDVLSDVMRRFRVTGAALLKGEYTAPWAWDAPGAGEIATHMQTPGARVVIFHIVAHGRCWLEVEGTSRVELAAGDLVGFPHGHGHRMGWGASASAFPIIEMFPAAPWEQVPTIRCVDRGELCRILCVYLRCDPVLFDPLTGALPRLILLRSSRPAGGPARGIVDMLIEEACAARVGSAGFTARLTELLFIHIVRDHLSRLGAGDRGWLAALNDAHVVRALQAFHAAPAHPWTLREVSAHAGASSSALRERFSKVLGISPMRYLTLWRLQVASALISAGETTIPDIAAQVGYTAPEAFARAFKRVSGVSPGRWRQQASTDAPRGSFHVN